MGWLCWRIGVFLLALTWPLLWLCQAEQQQLGPDPGKVLLERFGLGALILLLITLALTPLQRWLPWRGWWLVRRQLGLWCFVYSSLHVLAYLVFGLGFDLKRFWEALWSQAYLSLGFLAWLVLWGLVLTSNRLSKRCLGQAWKSLHRMVYPCLILVLLHQGLTVRSDWAEWALYAGIGAALLAIRWIPARTRP